MVVSPSPSRSPSLCLAPILRIIGITVTDSAVGQTEASHLHVMNKSQSRSSPPTSTTTLEQCETGAPEHFVHQHDSQGFATIEQRKINEKITPLT